MAEAPNQLGVHPTSMTYVYKVFYHLDMPWMGIWVHPYTATPVQQVGGDSRKIGVWLSWSDVVTSWLRLQTPVKCIPHPYHMHTKCFSTLVCCGWAHESTPTLLGLCNRWGGDLRKIGVWLSPSDVVMSWLRRKVHLTLS